MYCPNCGKKVAEQAVRCVACGVAVGRPLGAVKPKDKTVAVLLAVFLGFWTWCYTYKKDAWKFWLNLALFAVSIGFWGPVAWIWAVVDAARRPKEFYIYFNQSVPGQIPSSPVRAMPSTAAIKAMMFCPYCGRRIASHAVVCLACGRAILPSQARITKTGTAQEVAPAVQDPAAQMQARAAAAQQAELAKQQWRLKRLQSRHNRRLVFGTILTGIGVAVVIAMTAMFFSSPSAGRTEEQQQIAALTASFLFGLVPLAGGIALLLAAQSAKRLLVSERNEAYKKAETEQEKKESAAPTQGPSDSKPQSM